MTTETLYIKRGRCYTPWGNLGESTAGHYVHGWHDCQANVRRDLLAIATELEGRHD